jgi:hypothetical protein
MSDEFIESVHGLFDTAPTAAPGEEDLAVFALSVMGGAFARVPEDSAAMPRRDATF